MGRLGNRVRRRRLRSLLLHEGVSMRRTLVLHWFRLHEEPNVPYRLHGRE